MANGYDYIIKFGADTTSAIDAFKKLYKDFGEMSKKHSENLFDDKEAMKSFRALMDKINNDLIFKQHINLSDLIQIGDFSNHIKAISGFANNFKAQIHDVFQSLSEIEIFNNDQVKQMLSPLLGGLQEYKKQIEAEIKEINDLAKNNDIKGKRKETQIHSIWQLYQNRKQEGLTQEDKKSIDNKLIAYLKSFFEDGHKWSDLQKVTKDHDVQSSYIGFLTDLLNNFKLLELSMASFGQAHDQFFNGLKNAKFDTIENYQKAFVKSVEEIEKAAAGLTSSKEIKDLETLLSGEFTGSKNKKLEKSLQNLRDTINQSYMDDDEGATEFSWYERQKNIFRFYNEYIALEKQLAANGQDITKKNGLYDTFKNDVEPVIESIKSNFQQLYDLKKQVEEPVPDTTSKEAEKTTEDVEKTKKSVEGLLEKFESFKALDLSGFIGNIEKIAGALQKVVDQYDAVKDSQDSAGKSNTKTTETAVQLSKRLNKEMEAQKAIVKDLQKDYLTDAINKSQSTLGKVYTEKDKANKIEEWSQQKQKIQEITSAIKRFDEGTNRSDVVDQDSFVDSMIRISDEIDELSLKLLAGELSVGQYKNAVKELIDVVNSKSWAKDGNIVGNVDPTNLEAAKDAMKNYVNGLEGSKATITGWGKEYRNLTYEVQDATGAIEKHKLEFDSVTGNIIDTMMGVTIKKVKDQQQALEDLIETYKKAAAEFSDKDLGKDTLDSMVSKLGASTSSSESTKAKREIDDQLAKMRQIKNIQNQLNESGEANRDIKNFDDAWKSISAEVAKYNEQLLNGEITLKKHKSETDKLLKNLSSDRWQKSGNVIGIVDANNTNQARAAIDKYIRSIDNGTVKTGEFKEETGKMGYTIKDGTNNIIRMEIAYDKLTGQIENSVKGIKQAKSG
jgi:DNA repair exonuclease SbcCD ATPase subunit